MLPFWHSATCLQGPILTISQDPDRSLPMGPSPVTPLVHPLESKPVCFVICAVGNRSSSSSLSNNLVQPRTLCKARRGSKNAVASSAHPGPTAEGSLGSHLSSCLRGQVCIYPHPRPHKPLWGSQPPGPGQPRGKHLSVTSLSCRVARSTHVKHGRHWIHFPFSCPSLCSRWHQGCSALGF